MKRSKNQPTAQNLWLKYLITAKIYQFRPGTTGVIAVQPFDKLRANGLGAVLGTACAATIPSFLSRLEAAPTDSKKLDSR
jgi:hypothetical protein